MPKYEIEIPDGVLPEGTVPVAYRKPAMGETYSNPYDSVRLAKAPGDHAPKEARLIVEKRPEPKFKVGDTVRFTRDPSVTATIRCVSALGPENGYKLTYASGTQGSQYWFDDELEHYVEPQKPAQYQIGQIVTYQQGHYPKQQWVIRSFHRSSPGNNNVYKIRPVGPVHPVLNTEIFVDECDLSPYVEPKTVAVIDDPLPGPKFSKYDLVTLADYPGHAYTVIDILPHATNGTPWYYIRRCHDGYKQSASELSLIPWTEPELPPAKFKAGDLVTSSANMGNALGAVTNTRYLCTETGWEYEIQAKHWLLEDSLTHYVPKPEPKFKVGDWVKLDLGGFHRVERVWWSDISDTWRYDLSDHWQSNGTGTRLAPRVPLTQDDAVKLALGEITPKDIRLEDKRFKASLANAKVKSFASHAGHPVLWIHAKTGWDTAYPISDLTRLV